LRRAFSLIDSLGICIKPIFVLAAMMAVATLAFAGGEQESEAPQSGPFTGMVSDSICGARHVKHPELDSPRCARECVRTGARYILIDGDTSYNLQGDFAQLAQFAGQRAKISGSLQGSTIRVSSISEP
jgi:hypothetical protein